MAYKYSSKLLEHFEYPKNIGALKTYSVKMDGTNPKDGDWIEFYLLIKNDTVVNVGYLVKGCPRAIASSSYTSEIIKNKSLSTILSMNDKSIRESLSLEDPKFQCVSLPLKIIKDAITNYTSSKTL